MQEDRADDPEGRRLERDVVGDLVDPVGARSSSVSSGMEPSPARTRIRSYGSTLRRPGASTSADEPSMGAQRTSWIATDSRLFNASDSRPVDVHPANEPPLLGDAVERDAGPRRARGLGRRGGGPAGAVVLGLLPTEKVQWHAAPFDQRCRPLPDPSARINRT
jgi:hypothetical protein